MTKWSARFVGAKVVHMRRHEQRVTVTEKHEVIVRLPSDFPSGEAEVVVISQVRSPERVSDIDSWLEEWSAMLPAAPRVPLDAIDRDTIYP
jgi:hypothetical protein